VLAQMLANPGPLGSGHRDDFSWTALVCVPLFFVY